MLKLKVKRINPQAKMPIVAHPNEDLGYDIFYSGAGSTPITIQPGQQVKLLTGLALEHQTITLSVFGNEAEPIPVVFKIGLIGKQPSGLASKHMVDIKSGVIDPGYRNEISVLLYNYGTQRHLFYPGDKIGQLVPILCLTGTIEEVDELSDSQRGMAGWGSGHTTDGSTQSNN